MDKLVQELLAGSRRALARMLTVVENERDGMQSALAQLFPHTGQAWVIGVTGAPGTGKSSLVNVLAKAYRERDKTVAILAVDPTSPFSGGAILGDRIRMTELQGDKGAFIRSMATRGSLGGLARASRDAVRVLDAAGFDIIIVETVGAGQSEVDIVQTADTTLVIEAPGLGDDVQAIKAGILEIADILVVNKADRIGADQTVRGLRAMLELGHPTSRNAFTTHHGQLLVTDNNDSQHTPDIVDDTWLPPVIKTSAIENEGIDDLVEKIAQHRDFLAESGTAEILKSRYIEIELHERLRLALMQRLTTTVPTDILQGIIRKIYARELDPQSAVEQLLTHFY
ncbi:MAG: methylmalonyl Co-A mutase-associated GTPase MeaB [Phototrophicaceae bacterium]